MNYLIQRGKVRGQVINVPDGLPELLSDVTREVLRCQPTTECLCQFIIDYLHSILVTREKARVAKSIIDRALRQVDEIISDLCICELTTAKASEMALVMEECFKNFLEKYRCDRRKEREIVKFQELDMLDELIKRCKFSEEELKISRPMIEEAYNRFVQAYMDAAESSKGTEALYLYFQEREKMRLEINLQNRAATRIQSNFRGFLVRRSMFVDKKEIPREEEEEEEDDDDLDAKHQAARKIQRFYRKKFSKFQSISPEVTEKSSREEICSPKSQVSMEVRSRTDDVRSMKTDDGAPPVEAMSSRQSLQKEKSKEEVVSSNVEALAPEEEIETAPEPEPEIAAEPTPEPPPEPVPEVEVEPTAETAPPATDTEEPPAEPEPTAEGAAAAEEPPADPEE